MRTIGGCWGCRRSLWLLCIVVCVPLCLAVIMRPTLVTADQPQKPATKNRYIALELYVRGSSTGASVTSEIVAEFLASHVGIRIQTMDVEKDEAAQKRLATLAEYFKIESPTLPCLYGCNQFLPDLEGEVLRDKLTSVIRLDVYTRAGCPRCEAALAFLKRMSPRFPGFEVRNFEIISDRGALDQLQRLKTQYRAQAVSVPVFHLCNQLVIGFDHEATSGRRIESILEHWTHELPSQSDKSAARAESGPRSKSPGIGSSVAWVSWLVRRKIAAGSAGEWPSVHAHAPLMNLAVDACRTTTGMGDTALVDWQVPESSNREPRPPPETPQEPPPLLPLPGETTEPTPPPLPLPASAEDVPAQSEPSEKDTMEVPLLGRLSARELGLPLFTLAIGLVDGFNPCAMWVLLFLLSILVNLRDRRKILAIAGTFVLISGLAYYAFMAAWLNVFLLVGFLRSAQITLALLAILVGAVNIKDFVAFKRGITFSIPESAKPGIYARVRRIVLAENILGAVVGASVLAVLVNIIELLCTAGLPALYTEILTMRQLPQWQNYLYLGLYNVAYMFDDMLMVATVVITLGRRKMQEQQGRWLKLLSGAVVSCLGIVMLLKPEWLV